MLEYSSPVPLSATERQDYALAAVEFAEEAGRCVLPFFRSGFEISNKDDGGGFDPVTEADRTAEQQIRDRLLERYPSHGVFGEEFGHKQGDGLTWVIDPIDGTRAFMTGMLHWGVLIALFDGHDAVVGVMHQPFTGETFWGDGETASYHRGGDVRALSVSGVQGLSDAMVGSTGPQFFDPGELAAFDRLSARAKSTRFGGDCYIYCMVAMGFMDLAVETGLKPYDIQALIPIVRGAGGVVTDWQGGNPALGGRIVAAGSEELHAQALQVLSS